MPWMQGLGVGTEAFPVLVILDSLSNLSYLSVVGRNSSTSTEGLVREPWVCDDVVCVSKACV